MKLTYHGHSTFSLVTSDGARIVIDPWFDENPRADVKSTSFSKLDFIFCTHGHGDHFADALSLTKRTGATLVSSHEIAQFAALKGIQTAHGMSIGGGFAFPFGRVKMTPALHGGMVDGDESGRFTTIAAGFLFSLPDCRLYHAGDTALITDMQLLEGQVDVALLPIGDNYTMGPEDAARAVDFIRPKVVVPMHYNTFDMIQQDPEAFREMVGSRARVEALEPGETLAYP